jgi:hypothetical protein
MTDPTWAWAASHQNKNWLWPLNVYFYRLLKKGGLPDGITESQSADKVEYNVARLAQFLGDAIRWPLAEVTGQLKEELRRCTGNSSDIFKDDVSMLVIEYINSTGLPPEV